MVICPSSLQKLAILSCSVPLNPVRILTIYSVSQSRLTLDEHRESSDFCVILYVSVICYGYHILPFNASKPLLVSLLSGVNICCHGHPFFRLRPPFRVNHMCPCLNCNNFMWRVRVLKHLSLSYYFAYGLSYSCFSSSAYTEWRRSYLSCPFCRWNSS